jgi:hypothetical protein
MASDYDDVIRKIGRRAAFSHWPKASGWALAYQGSAMLLSNAYLLWLIVHRLVSPVGLAIFCLAELLLLSTMAWVEHVPVPQEKRFRTHQHGVLGSSSLVGRFFAGVFRCLFAVFWLSVTYGFSVWADGNLLLFAYERNALNVLVELNIVWPLLLSAVFGLIAMLGDWRLWQRRGGLFVPEMAQPSAPKTLTLFVAPIPAAMACFSYIDDDPNFALFAWCAAFIAIKSLFEVVMLGLEIFGMWIIDSTRTETPEPAALPQT